MIKWSSCSWCDHTPWLLRNCDGQRQRARLHDDIAKWLKRKCHVRCNDVRDILTCSLKAGNLIQRRTRAACRRICVRQLRLMLAATVIQRPLIRLNDNTLFDSSQQTLAIMWRAIKKVLETRKRSRKIETKHATESKWQAIIEHRGAKCAAGSDCAMWQPQHSHTADQWCLRL